MVCQAAAQQCTSVSAGALRRGGADLGRTDRHGHVRRGRNNRHNEREHQKSMNDLDDDDNFSMRFQSLDEVVGQVTAHACCYVTMNCQN